MNSTTDTTKATILPNTTQTNSTSYYNGWWNNCWTWHSTCETCSFKWSCANAKPPCYSPIKTFTTTTNSSATIKASDYDTSAAVKTFASGTPTVTKG